MKKTLAKGLALAFIGSLFVVGSAMAVPSLAFNGTYTFSNADGDNYLENLDLGEACINLIDPSTDGLLGVDYFVGPMSSMNMYGKIVFTQLTLDDTTPYHFNPTSYDDGFEIWDVDSNGTKTNLLLTADLEFTELEISTSAAHINSQFSMNLTNMYTGSAYSSGTSIIIDSLMAAPGGATNINFTAAGDLTQIIDNSTGLTNAQGTYSGAAAPVPEPATMLLFGTGLAGLATLRRRKTNK